MSSLFFVNNWNSIIISTILFLLLGSIRYSPFVFGNIRKSLLPSYSSPPSTFRFMVICLLIFFLSTFIILLLSYMKISNVIDALYVCLFILFFCIIPAMGIQYIFQNASKILFLIEMGYIAAGIMIVGIIYVCLG